MQPSLVLRSRKILKQILQPDVPLIVNFSGGKDSLVCLLLALSVTDRVECLYFDSGQELPGTLRYVDDRCREFGVSLNVSHPLKDRIRHKEIPDHIRLLPDYIRWWGYFPTEVYRYCGLWLKHRPGRIYCRKKWGYQTLYKVVGIRLDESQVRGFKYGHPLSWRRYRGRYVRPDMEHRGSYLVYPILKWTRRDVVEFLSENKVEIHEGYKHFGMSGCKWCPIAKPWQIRAIAHKHPGIYDDLLEAEKDIGKPAWSHKNLWLRELIP